ncbi:hypothetical protein P7C70_g4468, partial [Phenoliferia sp. Uapishka_3]
MTSQNMCSAKKRYGKASCDATVALSQRRWRLFLPSWHFVKFEQSQLKSAFNFLQLHLIMLDTTDIHTAPVLDKVLVSEHPTSDPPAFDSDSECKDESKEDVKEEAKAETSDIDWDSDDYSRFPELVREVVNFEDDPTLPTITFRVVLLSIIFVVVGSFVSQLSYFRTTTAPFPVFFVILASAPLGRILAKVLPDYKVPLGRYSFSLNPGPFGIKEHVIIGLAANAGSQGQWATYLPTNASLYYNYTMNPAVALFFGWYEEIGLAYSGAQYLWEIFMWYASYISSFVWAGCFIGPKLYNLYKARRAKRNIHTDRLSKNAQAYKDITLIEWGLLVFIPFIILLVTVIKGHIYMPVWTYFIALGFGAAAMLPLSAIYLQVKQYSTGQFSNL